MRLPGRGYVRLSQDRNAVHGCTDSGELYGTDQNSMKGRSFANETMSTIACFGARSSTSAAMAFVGDTHPAATVSEVDKGLSERRSAVWPITDAGDRCGDGMTETP